MEPKAKPGWGSAEYYRNQMRYWMRQSEKLRAEYNRLDDEAKEQGKDRYWWPTHTAAKALITDQQAAVREAHKYASALSAELAYLELQTELD